MLANAGNDGYSIERVGRDERGWRTRRRAVWEKGIRAVRVSPLCFCLLWGVSLEKLTRVCPPAGLPWRLDQVSTLGCSRWSLKRDFGALTLCFLFRRDSALFASVSLSPQSLRVFFNSTLTCLPPRVDYHWDDPRSEEEKSDSRRSVALGLPNPEHKSLDELADGVDISYTSAPDGFEVKFDANEVLEVVQWADDPRLRDFEAAFFDEGGVVNGQGF
jgi:hypothetical protein